MNAAFDTVITASQAERRDLFLATAVRLGTAVQNVEKDSCSSRSTRPRRRVGGNNAPREGWGGGARKLINVPRGVPSPLRPWLRWLASRSANQSAIPGNQREFSFVQRILG